MKHELTCKISRFPGTQIQEICNAYDASWVKSRDEKRLLPVENRRLAQRSRFVITSFNVLSLF